MFDHLFVAPPNFDRSLAFHRDTLQGRVDDARGGNEAPRGARLNRAGVTIVFACERPLPGDG